MKIGFYNPYLDSLSGGERYTLTLASHWSFGNDVSLFWDDPSIIREASMRLNLDLSRVKTVENVFKTRNIFRKLAVSRGYDVIFFLTDGSIPTTFARRNILHFQVPFANISAFPIKLRRFQAIVCNSRFTKKNLDPVVGKRSVVIYPPVTPIESSGKKKNKIVSVGRFHPLKKQDVLIEIFRKGAFGGYTLAFAGGLRPSDQAYFEKLKAQSADLPVQFYPNVTYKKLSDLYSEALIYWHGAGYGETRPENMEHFGITTVEAMSAGCIPVVYNGGGQPEIVPSNLWNTQEECIAITKKVIQSRQKQETLRSEMQHIAEKFTVSRFTSAFDQLLISITQ